MFFEGYTEKLWGRHPSQISADWGAQRVKGLSIMGVDAAWVKTIKGLVVIAAVAYDLLSKKKKG